MVFISRRAVVSAFAGLCLAPAARATDQIFSLQDVSRLARDLADEPFEAGLQPLPDALARLTYDDMREIRFRRDHRLLGDRGGSFRMELFHRGPLAQRAVAIHILNEGRVEPVPYEQDLFDYGRTVIDGDLPEDLGFAGLRLLYPLNSVAKMDELCVFLGASYFRFLGRGQRYGLSARTLAINSGLNPEEFPFFRAFWVEEPEPDALHIRLFALLDSPSMAGACSFTFHPQEQTRVDVEVELYPRTEIARLGLAPLTSMFFSGESDRRVQDDFRDEVHDSDGLLMQMRSGEFVWRPLRNPAQAILSSFRGDDLRGFGLMQRQRSWQRYSDIEAAYEMRPSYWVEPLGAWGAGRLELVELNAHEETVDNIVAFWSPSEPLAPRRLARFGWRITASASGAELHGGGQADHTFMMDLPRQEGRQRRRYMIDFVRGDLGFWARDPDQVKAIASVANGLLEGAFVRPNPYTGGLRAVLDVAGEPGQQLELRAFLKAGPHALTETWTAAWSV